MLEKVLITGGAGYLAGFIIDQLRQNYAVTLTDRVEPRDDFRSLRFFRADITDYGDIEQAVVDQDVVVHLTALVRGRLDRPLNDFVDVMVKGTWNVAEACAKKKVKLLINISSVVANGWPLVTAEGPYRVGDPSQLGKTDLYYALAKHLGEEIGAAYHQAYGLRVINLRPGIIANDGHNSGPERPLDGRRWWFAHVDPRDVAHAVQKAIEASHITQGTYQIVAGRGDTLFDWHEAAETLGYTPQYNWPDL